MWPVLLEIEHGPWHIVVRSYSACLAAAALIVLIWGAWAAIRRGLPARAVCIVLAITSLATLVGARLLYWARNPEAYANFNGGLADLHASGFAMDGGLLLAVAAGFLACRSLRISPWRLADALAAPVALGAATVRLGCFLNGCCFGRPTSQPWGVTFPFGSRVHLHQAASRLDVLLGGPVPVHPAQLYESAALMLAAFLVARRHPPEGAVALSVAAWFVVFRWFNTWFRATSQPPPFSGVTATLWVVLIAAGVIAVASRAGRDESRE